jgi:hypothetical protein
LTIAVSKACLLSGFRRSARKADLQVLWRDFRSNNLVAGANGGSGQAEANVKRIVALLVAIVALMRAGHCVQAESSQPPSVAGSSVVLINQGDQSLNFAFRPADGKWAIYSVGPGKSTTLSCDHCTVPYFEFSITTEGQQVNYRLMPAQTYLLQWNRDQHRWDLSHPESSR